MQGSIGSEYVEREYIEAQILGESGIDCSAAYPQCSQSLLNLVSQLQHL